MNINVDKIYVCHCNKIVYRNENDVCYKYQVEETKCTDKVIEQPII